jgi:very-short-patch-repair endonuclease
VIDIKSIIKRNHSLLENARKLRRDMTVQEKHLWYDFLRDYPVKIYKQRIIDNFIVDFYCAKARLVIEIDGSQHYTFDGKHHDRLRSDVIEKYKLKVIRFSNNEVDKKFDGVCSVIDKTIKERIEN